MYLYIYFHIGQIIILIFIKGSGVIRLKTKFLLLRKA